MGNMQKCNRRQPEIVFDHEETSDGVSLCAKFNDAMNADFRFNSIDCSVFDARNVSYDPPILINQFDMAITQLGFLIAVIAQSEAFGICDIQGIEGFGHLWALLGRLSGIQDRFKYHFRNQEKISIPVYGRNFFSLLRTKTMRKLIKSKLLSLLRVGSFFPFRLTRHAFTTPFLTAH